MYTTVIKDEKGNLIPCPKSHRNTADAIRAIAAAKIKAYNLNCTVEEYLARCAEVKKSGAQ